MLWRKLVQAGYPQSYPQLILMLTNDFTVLTQIFLTVIHKYRFCGDSGERNPCPLVHRAYYNNIPFFLLLI